MKLERAVAIGTGVMIAAVAVTLLARVSVRAGSGPAHWPAWEASHPLRLMARPEQGRVIVSWNREAEAIRKASRATLTITDAGRRDEVALGAELLRTRDLAYLPLSRVVTFQLKVESTSPRLALTEWVLVLNATGNGASKIPCLPATLRRPG